jgi:hypothetical protein
LKTFVNLLWFVLYFLVMYAVELLGGFVVMYADSF